MTTVNNVGAELKVPVQQQEGTTVSRGVSADAQLKEAFTYESGEDVKLQTPVKAQDLDYSGFPKSNRLDASDFASRSLNEVKDAVREFNADFPDKPYVADYSSFPKPESFNPKTYGGKDKAYMAWKSAVAEWVEDCKQDMVTARSQHIGSMTEKFESAMNRGFFNLYLQAGMTRDYILATFEALDGNINKVKAQLDAKAQEIMQNSRRVGANVNANVNRAADRVIENNDINTSGLHNHISISENSIHQHIDDARNDLNNNIDYTRKEVVGAIETDGSKTRAEVAQKAKETQEIESLSTAISAGLHENTHTEKTLTKVEDLKDSIIRSTKISHTKKLELLTSLRELAMNDDWITDKDLDEIVREYNRINL